MSVLSAAAAEASVPFARLADFFARLLAPGEFTSSLLERSFNQTAGWVEAVLALAVPALYGYWRRY